MKYLRNLAIMLTICMIVSILPIMSFAAVSKDNSVTYAADEAEATSDPQTTVQPDVTAEPDATEAPDVTADPNATTEPEATVDPSATADPNATEAPDVTADPNATADPGATADPNATASPSATPDAAKYSINISSVEHSKITSSVASAAEKTRVTLVGKADRGYIYTDAYYLDSAEKRTALITTDSNSFTRSVVMPASDITVYATVEKMTPSQVYSDASKQYADVTSDLETYERRYTSSSSSNYDAADIRDMRNLISEAKKILPDLKDTYTYLNTLIRDDDVTDSALNDVIYLQEELDEITNQIDELVNKMGGSAEDGYYDLYISLSRGGRVTVSGAVSGTVDAFSSNNDNEFTDNYFRTGDSLTFRIQTQSGYSVNYFRINGRNVQTNGNTLTINSTSLERYISDGNGSIEVVINFVYGSNGNYGGGYGGGYTGSTYGGTTYGGTTGSTDTNTSGIPSAPAGSAIFSDLGNVEWAVPSITALYNMGIVNGVGDGLFDPQSPVTREQFAKMIVGVMGYQVDQSATTGFSDDAGDWYSPYIAAASANGIITGRDDGTFGVGDNITREDIAVIIHRTQGSPAVEIHEFPDSANISSYAVEAVSYLYANQIASGDDQGNFNPINSATRAEASKMLYGLYTLTH